MTLTVSGAALRYAGNGTADTFAYQGVVFATSDLVVHLEDADGNAAEQTLNVDYTVTGVGLLSGGSVVFTTPPASGETVSIRVSVPTTQPQSIRNQGSFLPEIHETAFDRLTRQVQKLERQLSFAMRLPDYGPEVDMTIPSLANRKGKFWAHFDATTGEPELFESIGATALSQSIVGQHLWPQTAAEISAGVTPTYYYYPPGDVRRYGAVLTGSSDDSAALQSACHTGVGLVTIPYSSGGCKVSNTVTVPSYTRIFGQGMPTLKQGTSEKSIFDLSNSTDVEISGIAFDGNSKGSVFSTYTNCAIMSDDTSDGVVKNCAVHHCRFKGFYSWCVSFAGNSGGASGYSYGVRIHDNYIENQVDEGLNLYYMKQSFIQNNEIRAHAKEAIKATTCDDISIKGNRIYASATGATDGPLINVGTDCNDIVIEGNRTYKGNKGIGIEKRVIGLQILGNYCSDCLQEGIGVASTVADTVAMSRVVIANNMTKNTGQHGIKVQGLTSYEARQIQIVNNNVYNCGTGTAAPGILVQTFLDAIISGNVVDTSAKDGIHATTGNCVVIDSNRVNSVQLHGVRVESVVDVSASRNMIYDPNRNAASNDGVNIDSGCTNGMAVNNVVKALSGNFSNGIDNQSTAPHVMFNVVTGNAGNAVQLAGGIGGGIGLLSQLAVTDGISAPNTVAGYTQIYVDVSDGDLKAKFGDGTVKTIVVDT